MITISSTVQALQRFFEATAKARVNSTLLGMGRAKVEQLGYSYEALLQGPNAWPWRKTTQDSARERELQGHIPESHGFCDRQLDDTGIPRHGVEFDRDAA